MVRPRSLFLALILVVGASAHGWSTQYHILASSLQPGAAEIQEISFDNRVMQSFTTGGALSSGVEFFACSYPKNEERKLVVRLIRGGVVLSESICELPGDLSSPVRACFDPVQTIDTLSVEFYVLDGSPGHSARMLFFPIDNYGGGALSVGGSVRAGDLLFRILTPATSGLREEIDLDLFTVQGRFPSPAIPFGSVLTQEFVTSHDSLSSVEFMVGTGGRLDGPLIRFELDGGSRHLAEGVTAIKGDNQTVRISFPPIHASAALPLNLTIRLEEAWDGEFRLWLCRRSPGTGALVVGDRLIDASLILRSYFLHPSPDSMRVLYRADQPLSSTPTLAVAGDCELEQDFRWPGAPSPEDLLGLRLAVGGGLTAGEMTYTVKRISNDEVVGFGRRQLSGVGANEFLWFDLGWPHDRGPFRIRLSAADTRAENGARFWWLPVRTDPGLGARGCVPATGGDCIIRLAQTHTVMEWIRILLALPRRPMDGTYRFGDGLLLAGRIVLLLIVLLGSLGELFWSRRAGKSRRNVP